MASSTLILVLYLFTFAAIHSIVASLRFKRFLRKLLGRRVDTTYMPAFSIMAVLTLLPLAYVLYKNPGTFLYIVPSPWRWLMVGGQLAAAIVAPMAFRDAPHRFRVSSQLAGSGTAEAGHLDVRGVYRWVRDPFLFSGLAIMWLTPFMTVNLLIVYVLTTIYLYLGSLHWESRLIAQFGDEYLEYKKQVRRIIPRIRQN